MKKYNEGYTLPFVLVVFLIISLVAVSLLTITLNNLRSQKALILRMEQQYAAQAGIERTMSRLGSHIEEKEGVLSMTVGVSHIIADCHDDDPVSTVVFVDEKLEETTDDNKVTALMFRLASTCGTVRIDTAVKITGSIQYDSMTTCYKVTDVKMEYDTYTISTVEES